MSENIVNEIDDALVGLKARLIIDSLKVAHDIGPLECARVAVRLVLIAHRLYAPDPTAIRFIEHYESILQEIEKEIKENESKND